MRASVTVLAAAVVLAALPAATQAQTRTTTRGAFGGAVSSDTTVGPFRGSVPQGATLGAVRGAVTSDTVIGAVRNAPSTAIGGFRAETPTEVVGVAPGQFRRMSDIWFRGAVSPGAVGAFGAPAPSDTVLGRPGPRELEGRLNSEATMAMWDGNYKRGEVMLNRAVEVREEIAGGAVRPEVAAALDHNASFLRDWNRNSAAADMESRANEIRTRFEAPPAAKRTERAERF